MAESALPPIGFGSVRVKRGALLGSGTYGQVFRATLDELPCAAKLLNDILLDPSNATNRTCFQQECRLLSEIRHPNIIQYLGTAEDEELGLPLLLMELMDDSLTHFLEQSEESLAYHVQVNISHDITLAVAFLHMNGIIHRDLSSNNVLVIGPGSKAKVANFGMSTLTELNPHMTGLSKCPGNPAYMSPEALLDPPVYTEKLDCFQVGVLMLQIMTRKYPVPGQAMNQVQDSRSVTGWKIDPVPELQRRYNHLSLVAETHLMLCNVKNCLKDTYTERPSAQQICRCLSALKETPQYVQSVEGRVGKQKRGESVEEGKIKVYKMEGEAKEREELCQQLKKENHVKDRERWEEREVKEESKVENIGIETQVKETENKELENLQTEIQVKEAKKETLSRVLREKGEEIREKEREVENLRGVVHVKERDIETFKRVAQEKEKDARVKSEEIEHLHCLIEEKDQTMHQLQQTQLFASSSFTCLVSGPGLQSATANYPTRVVVELSASSGMCSAEQNISAELIQQSASQATPAPTRHAQQPAAVTTMTSPSRYEVLYIAVRRGPHKLHVQVNGSEINDSPFTMTVYPDPTQLGSPVRVVKQLNQPYGIALNRRGEIIVSERGGHQVSVFDVGGQKIRTFGSHGDRLEQMISPAGIAVDDMDNIYVSSKHKLQKFTSSGKLIECIGWRGSRKEEFDDPRGVTIHSNQIYICDTNNHRIQVFDLNLKFIGSIGSRGSGKGEFDHPVDVAFDTAGNMYVADFDNNRVQVMDSSGQFIRMFGQEGKGTLHGPTALHIADKYVYVSDWRDDHVAVYEISGDYVTTFGRRGEGEREFRYPYCITSCASGCIYVCDSGNNKVQVF